MSNDKPFTVDTTHQGGGSDPNQSEGPLRPGLIPRRVEFPFVTPPFYRAGMQGCMRRKMPETGQKWPQRIHVRQKKILPATTYNFSTFARVKG